MSPELGQAGFRIGCLLVFPSAVLLLFLERGTAEFTITAFTLVMGLLFLAFIAAVVLRSR